jgi:hypothetical protein
MLQLNFWLLKQASSNKQSRERQMSPSRGGIVDAAELDDFNSLVQGGLRNYYVHCRG